MREVTRNNRDGRTSKFYKKDAQRRNTGTNLIFLTLVFDLCAVYASGELLTTPKSISIAALMNIP